MQGKILIVDAIATNRIVMKVKLASAFYQVLQAATVSEAAEIMQAETPGLIIASLSLPDAGMKGLLALLSTLPGGETVPVLGISNAGTRQERLTALSEGVSDVLPRPLDNTLLLSRVRSLIRAHNAVTEWQMRDCTTRGLGMSDLVEPFVPHGQITLICEDAPLRQRWLQMLRPLVGNPIVLSEAASAIEANGHTPPSDAFVLVLNDTPKDSPDTLHLISALRANAATQHAGLLVVQKDANGPLTAHALDLGADDVMVGRFDPQELAIRLKSTLRRKHRADHMRNSIRSSLRDAVFDPMTGLYNRRYAIPYLERVSQQAIKTQMPFAVLLADLDHFKRINDTYGHASGDTVLVETSDRLRQNLRSHDMVARYGGEEFLIIMPMTHPAEAELTARRLCNAIGEQPFEVPGASRPVDVTISIGLAVGSLGAPCEKACFEQPETIIDRADQALYKAKVKGRNRVKLSRPAA